MLTIITESWVLITAAVVTIASMAAMFTMLAVRAVFTMVSIAWCSIMISRMSMLGRV